MGNNVIQVELSQRQDQAWEALDNCDVREVLYGGAKGGGKSWLGCLWMYAQCKRLIADYQIPPQKYPIPVGWMGRKANIDFVSTTLETWKQAIPSAGYELRSGDQEIVIDGRVKIEYGGLDASDNRQRFNSAEYCWIFVDQAEETDLDEVAVLRGSLRRKVMGREVPTKSLWTANPAQCWLKSEFLKTPRPDRVFVQALPSDNPNLPKAYINRLREAFGHRPELLAAYLDGDWSSFEGANQLIREGWLAKARTLTLYPSKTVNVVVCDVARFGDDETVIYRMLDGRPVSQEIYGQKDLMYTANRLFVHWKDHGEKECTVVVDDTGVGGGVTDRLREMDVPVIAVNGAEKPSTHDFTNLRSEMWWKAAQELSRGDVSLREWVDDVLDSQLVAPTYEFRGPKLQVEPKQAIKDRLKRSPDRGDCYVMGLHATRLLRGQEVSGDGIVRYLPSAKPKVIAPNSFADRRQQYEHKKRLQEEYA
jgi:hypothetical protein